MTMLEILTSLLLLACVVALVLVARAISLVALAIRGTVADQFGPQDPSKANVRFRWADGTADMDSGVRIRVEDYQPARGPRDEKPEEPPIDYTRDPDGAEMDDQMLGPRGR